jgi:hypothetical protein
VPTHRPTSLQAALAVLRAELAALRDLLDEDEYAMLTEILEIWLRGDRPEERAGSLLIVAVEGAVDRFCGRPRAANPYVRQNAPDPWRAWRDGWTEADSLLDERGAEEARRWLAQAA